MTLIKSISGIRGTIGGKPGEGLSPQDIVKFTAAFCTFVKQKRQKDKLRVVIGRDARLSGRLVNSIVCGTLEAMGVDVIDIGLTTTPTTEMAVTNLNCDAGIILTASHNPKQWNALKLLNHLGEFISAEDGAAVLEIADKEAYTFAEINQIGSYSVNNDQLKHHVDAILALKLVDVEAIKNANFTVAIDCVNSTGGITLPYLLKELGVTNIIELNCEPTGIFAHNPEPLPEHLREISELMANGKANVGFVVDPDVDRLAIVNEDGTLFGEEYTLVAIADYILKNTGGNTVSNLSSTQALRDVTLKAGFQYAAAAVGEVNVVEKMKETAAVIGGEGNGGVIYPELHYGRDALVGIALFLTHLAKSQKKCSALRKQYPGYFISKNKIELFQGMDTGKILDAIKQQYSKHKIIDIDGVKIEFGGEWVHLRKSNTEPIIRIYSESDSEAKAEHLAQKILVDIKEIAQGML